MVSLPEGHWRASIPLFEATIKRFDTGETADLSNLSNAVIGGQQIIHGRAQSDLCQVLLGGKACVYLEYSRKVFPAVTKPPGYVLNGDVIVEVAVDEVDYGLNPAVNGIILTDGLSRACLDTIGGIDMFEDFQQQSVDIQISQRGGRFIHEANQLLAKFPKSLVFLSGPPPQG